MASYLAGRFNDFPHRVSISIAKVECVKRIFVEVLQSSNVRPGEIDDVRVIANTGPVARRIIVTVNRNLFALTESDLQHQRNEMALGLVRLPILFRSAGGIEITERDRAQAVDLVVPL